MRPSADWSGLSFLVRFSSVEGRNWLFLDEFAFDADGAVGCYGCRVREDFVDVSLGENHMASTRAAEVAELLWELKRADKVATYSAIAQRAGFSAGANGRAMNTCLKTVRRDWPHLQWWRAISDDATVEEGSEQAEKLTEFGIEVDQSAASEGQIKLALQEDVLMSWNAEQSAPAAS